MADELVLEIASGADAYALHTKTSFAAVVCTYNRYDVLDGAIASLLGQSIDDFEIVVVDNSSDHHTAEKWASKYRTHSRVRYLIEKTPGLSRARNVGVARSTADIIAFLDDDAIADRDWASAIIRAFEDYPGHVAVVGGLVAPRWASPQPEWLNGHLLNYLSIINWGEKIREITPEEWLAGCNIAFKRSFLGPLGGFAEALGRNGANSLLSNEETHLVSKIRAAGGRIVYTPFAKIEHIIDPSRLSEQWFYKRVAWQAVSDFMSDGERSQKQSVKSAERIAGFLQHANNPDNPHDRISGIYNIVNAILGGQSPYSPQIYSTNKYRKSRKSRLAKNLKTLPRKAVSRIKSVLSKI